MPVHLDAGGEVRTPVSASEVGHGRVIADAEGYVRQSAAAARGGRERRRRTTKAAGGGVIMVWCLTVLLGRGGGSKDGVLVPM